MQMMQLEFLRLQVCLFVFDIRIALLIPLLAQTIQNQQYQAELIAQVQRQQQSQARRGSINFSQPASAGPLNNSFDLRTAAAVRRASQAEQLKSQLGVGAGDSSLPMSAGPNGKFGSRIATPSGLSKSLVEENDDTLSTALHWTTVISGGTSLGNPVYSNNTTAVASNVPSKSESAVSWRRGGNNNSVLSGNNRAVTSPSVKITPPPGEGIPLPAKARPVPLRFNLAASQSLPSVAIDTSADGGDGDDGESTSSKSASNSAPTTPRSASSNDTPLSPREEAAKKLYEGLGIGRPVPATQIFSAVSHRMASQPLRQPRGPPSGADELGPKNFATRIRRKAIGGLGALMGARERREIVEAY
jgi:hypothetical protein